MNLKIIYLITVLIGYVPKMIENTIYQIKYLKEGYFYTDTKSFLKDLFKPIIEGVLSLIPILNILRGIKSIKRIKNIKSSYADYKLDQILDGTIYKKGFESNEEKIDELFLTVADSLGKDEEEKKNYRKTSEILSLLIFLEEHEYEELDEKTFDSLSIDEKIEYLKNIKSEILSNINNDEEQKEDNEEIKLIRRNNDKK